MHGVLADCPFPAATSTVTSHDFEPTVIGTVIFPSNPIGTLPVTLKTILPPPAFKGVFGAVNVIPEGIDEAKLPEKTPEPPVYGTVTVEPGVIDAPLTNVGAVVVAPAQFRVETSVTVTGKVTVHELPPIETGIETVGVFTAVPVNVNVTVPLPTAKFPGLNSANKLPFIGEVTKV